MNERSPLLLSARISARRSPRLAPRLAPLALLLSACAADLTPRDEEDGIIGGGDGKVVTTSNGDGSYTTLMNSAATETWAQLDLDLGVESIDPDDSWDLAAQRFHLRLHEGSRVMQLGDVPLLGVNDVAPGTWLVDEADGDDENTTPDYAFEQAGGWYQYDAGTHVLTPSPITWLVQTSEGQYRAVRIESYYDSAGTSGRFRLRWKPVRPN